jgi:hypothetical protein
VHSLLVNIGMTSSGRPPDGKAPRCCDFIKAIAGSTAAWSIAAGAQQSMIPVIGFLNTDSPQGYGRQSSVFLEGLGENGYVDGRNVTIDHFVLCERRHRGNDRRLRRAARARRGHHAGGGHDDDPILPHQAVEHSRGRDRKNVELAAAGAPIAAWKAGRDRRKT